MINLKSLPDKLSSWEVSPSEPMFSLSKGLHSSITEPILRISLNTEGHRIAKKPCLPSKLNVHIFNQFYKLLLHCSKRKHWIRVQFCVQQTYRHVYQACPPVQYKWNLLKYHMLWALYQLLVGLSIHKTKFTNYYEGRYYSFIFIHL